MDRIVLESLGGYFIAMPEKILPSWRGYKELADKDLGEKFRKTTDWFNILKYSEEYIFIFGGDITSCELINIGNVDILVRRIYTGGDDISKLVEGCVSNGVKERVRFNNKSNYWIIFDSTLCGDSALKENKFLKWPLPLGNMDFITYSFEDEYESFIAHVPNI
ncbi:MAG: hypothetical protein WDN06_05645 [Asticcacaulis sp.]